MHADPTWGRLVFFAMVAGASLLFLPVMVLPIGVCCVCWLWRAGHSWKWRGARVCAVTLVLVFCVAPYIGWQYVRLGKLCFVKSNGPYEFALGNTAGFDGVLTVPLFASRHPAQSKVEFEAYRTLGETAYVRTRAQAFLQTFELQTFVTLCVKRAAYFFFLFHPYNEIRQLTASWIARYIAYAVSGVAFVCFVLWRGRRMRFVETVAVGYILMYALPYVCAGVMYRYSFPLCTLTSIMLAFMLTKAAPVIGQCCGFGWKGRDER